MARRTGLSDAPESLSQAPENQFFFFPTRSFYFLLALGKQASESRRRNANVEKQKREKGRARKRTTRHANGVSISSQSVSQSTDGVEKQGRAEQEKHGQIKRIELRRISQSVRASDAVCSIRKRALPCVAALRFCSLLQAPSQSSGEAWRNRRILRFGHRHSQSLRAKQHAPWRCATAG